MGCPCNGSSTSTTELWEAVFPDQTVGTAKTKTAARQEAQARGGYIRKAA